MFELSRKYYREGLQLQLASGGLIHFIGNTRKLHAVPYAASLVGGLMLRDCKRVGIKGIMIYSRYVDTRSLTTSILKNKCYTFCHVPNALKCKTHRGRPECRQVFHMQHEH